MQINNYVDITGRIGKDPELRTTQSGKKTITLSVAVSEYYLKDGEKIDKTDWFSVVAWEKTAELLNIHSKKGDLIRIVGKLQTRSWEDQQGQKRYATEIICNEFRVSNFINNTENKPSNKEQSKTNRPKDDDIPF